MPSTFFSQEITFIIFEINRRTTVYLSVNVYNAATYICCQKTSCSAEVIIQKSHKFSRSDVHLSLQDNQRLRSLFRGAKNEETKSDCSDQSRLADIRHPQLFNTRQSSVIGATRTMCMHACTHTYMRARRDTSTSPRRERRAL